MARRNKSRFALLGLLTLGDMSGYDLRKLFGQSLIHFWNESYGQIYPELRRMAAEGLVDVRQETARGKPARNVYTLTPKGREALDDWLSTAAEPSPYRIELLLKLFFGRQADPATSRSQVLRFQQEQRRLLERYQAIERQLEAEAGASPDQPYWLMTLSYGQHLARALLAWSEETLNKLESSSR